MLQAVNLLLRHPDGPEEVVVSLGPIKERLQIIRTVAGQLPEIGWLPVVVSRRGGAAM